jgi:uncharacterized protein (TIGR00251 family)
VPTAFFRADSSGLVLALRVSPKSSRDQVLGPMDLPGGQSLKVAVSAPPDRGRANDAVCALLADEFAVAKGAVHVVAGETDRHKKVRVLGNPSLLAQIAQRWAERWRSS